MKNAVCVAEKILIFYAMFMIRDSQEFPIKTSQLLPMMQSMVHPGGRQRGTHTTQGDP